MITSKQGVCIWCTICDPNLNFEEASDFGVEVEVQVTWLSKTRHDFAETDRPASEIVLLWRQSMDQKIQISYNVLKNGQLYIKIDPLN